MTVRPRVRLAKVASHRYSLRVLAAQSFAGKYGTFQRYNGAVRRWANVKRVLLRANSTGIAPTVIYVSVSFRATLPPRARRFERHPAATAGRQLLSARSQQRDLQLRAQRDLGVRRSDGARHPTQGRRLTGRPPE